MAGPRAVNRPFQAFRRSPENSGSSGGTPALRKPGSQAFPYPRGGGGQRLGSLRLRTALSRTYVPSRASVAAPFRAEAAIYWGRGPASTGLRKESRRPAECRTVHLGKRLDPQ